MPLLRIAILATCVGGVVVPGLALAHWCDCLWASWYNLVVRLEVDTVSIGAGATQPLKLFVQNNMGYPLPNFVLEASAPGYSISVGGPGLPISGQTDYGTKPFLMPGEKIERTLNITRTSGAQSLSVDSIAFGVKFGNGAQDNKYGFSASAPTGAVAVRRADGTTSQIDQAHVADTNNCGQACNLQYAQQADFGTTPDAGLDKLLRFYCAGRGSWSNPASYCPDATTTVCPPAKTGVPSNDDWKRVYTVTHLAARKGILGSRLPVARDRMKCAWADDQPGQRYLAAISLGYAGFGAGFDDQGTRDFFTPLTTSGTSEDQAVAKAGLLLAGGPATLRSDVVAGLSSPDKWVKTACAAALGIYDGAAGDATVKSVLIPNAANWFEPDSAGDPFGFYAAHLLSIVAWDRRGFQTQGADTGYASFYGGTVVQNYAPVAPANASCITTPEGNVRVSWNGVSTDTNGGAETVAYYKVYYANSARSGGCAGPADCSYAHSQQVSGTFYDFASLDGGQTFYFAITAFDTQGLQSNYSVEVHCLPIYTPVADLSCTPTSGAVPLEVTCQAGGSTDGNDDIATYSFQFDSDAPAGPDSGTQRAFTIASPGSHRVRLTVTDATALSDTAYQDLTVTSAANLPPTAVVDADQTSGPAPLTVAFSSASSSDPEGTALTFSWNFADGSPSTSASPSHTFNTPGSYQVMLTVMDSGTPAATDIDSVTIVVTGTNRPPVVDSASASPMAGTAPLAVNFDATGVTDPDADTFTLSWDFGDSSAGSSAVSPSHTYATAGGYTAKLTATDSKGAANSKELAITVSQEPLVNHAPDCAAAKVTPLTGPAPLALSLDASGCTDPDGNALTYLWRVPTSFTEEASYATAVAAHTYNDAWTATLTLVVRDDGTPAMETSKTFEVTATEAVAGADAGSAGSSDGGHTLDVVVAGCGCTSAHASPAVLLAILAGLALARRHRP